LGFPSNQFANQEPGKNEEIKSFCKASFGVDFPMFEKVDVKGPNIHPLFKHLCEQKKGIFSKTIKWNFTKFLVDASGEVVYRFAPSTPPSKLEQRISELIAKI
jgi:glutathione peroxidase